MSEETEIIDNGIGEAERIAVDFNEDGTLGNITIEDTPEGMSDVQAGIEFIYHMREHLLDIGVATVYFFSVYAIYLWITKKIKG